MAKANFEVKRKCELCGKVFIAKTLESKYCSPQCSKRAWKRKKDEEKKLARLKLIADKVPDTRDYISITEAIAIYGVGRSTLYRLIRLGRIPSINLGEKLIRIKKSDLGKVYPERKSVTHDEPTENTLYNMSPENCYTIGEISKKYNINDSTVWAHIRRYSIPTRQIGNYVYAPKSEIDKLYKNL